jgi:hypothetical protein
VSGGNPSGDGVSRGSEQISRRCDQITGERHWRHCGERSLLGLQQPAGDAKAAVMDAYLRDLIVIAERKGFSDEINIELLALQQQLFVQWHWWKDE